MTLKLKKFSNPEGRVSGSEVTIRDDLGAKVGGRWYRTTESTVLSAPSGGATSVSALSWDDAAF